MYFHSKIVKRHSYWGPGVPWVGPWGPLGLGDPWALGTLGLGDPGPWGPWALGTLGPWGPWALGTLGPWGLNIKNLELTSDASHLS